MSHLDPHFTQKAYHTPDQVNASTYHCSKPKTIHISKLDPTCTIGFVFRERREFQEFQRLCEDSKLFHRDVTNSKLSCPMVAFGKRENSESARIFTENDMCVIEDSMEVNSQTPQEDVGYRKKVYEAKRFVGFKVFGGF